MSEPEQEEVKLKVWLCDWPTTREDETVIFKDGTFEFTRVSPSSVVVKAMSLARGELEVWGRSGFRICGPECGFKIPTVIPWHMVRKIELEIHGSPKA